MEKQLYPEPTVGVLVFNSRGEMLLVKSHKWRGKYVVPGGHVELGETAVAAARREVREETGLDISNIRFLCWQECIYDESFWQPKHFIFLDFTASTEDSRVVLNEEAQDFIWIDPAEALNRLEVDAYTAVSIRKFLQQPAEAA